jgi:hypothetical protein
MIRRTTNVLFSFASALALAVLCQTPIADVQAQAAPGCAPFPAFPDSSCTGWAHTGVTLTDTASCTLSTPGAVYDSMRFNCKVLINANNVTIKRSQVNGAIDDAGNHSGLLVEDTLIDCGNATIQGIGHSMGGSGVTSAGFTARRVEVRNCSWGFYAAQMTVEDSYCHEIYGTGTQHNECVLGFGPGPHSFKHNTFFGEYNAASSIAGGGMSSAVSFYVHGSFWDDITQGILFEQNFLRAERADGIQAGFCLYGGKSTVAGEPDDTTNGIFRNNVFARGATGQCGVYGAITGPASGPGSCWASNRYDDGTPISVPAPTCSGSTPRPPAALTVL